MLLAMNEFAKRQTEDSPFTHFDGTWSELVELVERELEEALLYADPDERIVKISVSPVDFWSPVVNVLDHGSLEFITSFEARRPNEEPHLVTVARGRKAQAKYVEVICYSHDALVESGDNSTDAEYEIVAFNATIRPGADPMDPFTMARNFLGKEGGTKPETAYTALDFANAIWFWGRHVKVQP